MNRRPTYATGYSWRKWGDPFVYRRPWWPDLFLWASSIAFGAAAAFRVVG